MRIRTIILLTIVLASSAILGSGYWVTHRHMNTHVEELSQEYLSFMADGIRSTITHQMADGASAGELLDVLHGIQQRNPNIIDVRIIPDEVVSRQFEVSTELPDGEGIGPHDLTADNMFLIREMKNGLHIAHFHYPIHAEQKCLQCHMVETGDKMGTLTISANVTDLENKMQESNLQLLALNLIQLVIFLLVMGYVLNRLIFSRLENLGQAVHAVARGDYQFSLKDRANDELGRVCMAFMLMAEKIRSLIYERDELIKEQAGQLLFLQQMSQVLAKSQIINDTLDDFAETFTLSTHVALTRIALLNEDKTSLSVRATHSPRGKINPADTAIVCHQAQCPSIWEVIHSRQYRLIEDIHALDACEKHLFDIEDAATALCMPIIGKLEVHGLVILIEQRATQREPLDEAKTRFCQALAHQLGAAIEHGHLQDSLVLQSEQAVLAMAEAVDKKSPWTAGHSKRVTAIAVQIAEQMGWEGEQLEELRLAGLLHDIGKIGTPERILNKIGELSDNEKMVMHQHPVDGADIVSKLSHLHTLVPAIRYHHEFFDGKGYPEGLQGEAIPLAARIMAVADTYDAMVSNRPYRRGMSHKDAMARIRLASGTQFDPNVVKAFLASCREQTE